MSKKVTAFDPHAPVHGSTVGPWLILDRLDSGSFGIVYKARRAGHPDSPPVAMKMAKRPRDPRFQREAELLRLDLSGAPRFEDEGLWTAPNGLRYPYVVMELVEGLLLYDWFQGGRTSREVLQVLAHVAGALASAHARGAVHRDVKGDNIRVTPKGRAVLVDWGSGWFSGARPLTDTTAPPGTTAYRPPEQRFFIWRFRKDAEARWQAQPTDDLYSLGVAFYRCVTGIYLPPLSEGGEVEHVREVPAPSDYATISRDLEALILRLLSNKREERGTAEALAREAAALASAAGDAADEDILPTASAKRTDSGGPCSDGREDEEVLSDMGPSSSSSSSTRPGRRPRRRHREENPDLPTWLTVTLSSALGAALVAFLVLLLVRAAPPREDPQTRWLAMPAEVSRFAPDAGVGEKTLSSVHEISRAAMPLAIAIGEPMPKTPFPGQKKPPCDPDGEIAALGACWVVMKKEPPCKTAGYDFDGLCIRASFTAPRQPTSDQP